MTLDLVSEYQLDIQQLVHLVWERTTEKGTPEQRRHQEKKQKTHSHTHTVALLRHVKNVVQLETCSLTGCDFHDWTNQHHKQDSNNGCNQLT